VPVRTRLAQDEPVNGLDLDGIRWIRDLMKTAAEGRTDEILPTDRSNG
jgi:ABC-type multidrug transport system ATPase subunit